MDTKFVNYYIDIFNAIESNLNNFEHNQKYRLTTFSIFIKMRSDLKTSDSFQFAKTCAAVKLLFESLDEKNMETSDDGVLTAKHEEVTSSSNAAVVQPSSQVDEDCIQERQRVLLAVLTTATDNYRWTWAQHSIDSLVNMASERRLSFYTDIREELDAITERITQQRRKNVSYTGSKKVVTSSTIAHPLFSKKYDTWI